MRRWRAHRLSFLTIGLAMCFGCGPPTLDVSDPVAFGTSLAKLRQSLTADEQRLFEESLVYLVGDAPEGPEAGQETPEEVVDRHRPLAGLTADAIISQAWIGRSHEVRSAIEGLESGRDASTEARRQLALFRFDEVQVYKRNRGYLEWPVIEIKATNETNHMVYLIHFRAALLRSGEPSPWLEEEFDHVVFEGLAPGERAVWRIEPKQREWIRLIDPHPELEFTLEAMRLEALGGTVLTAAEWGMVEARRLELYLRTLDRIKSLHTLALDGPPFPAGRGRTAAPAEAASSSTAT
jgi:hypothetical protein